MLQAGRCGRLQRGCRGEGTPVAKEPTMPKSLIAKPKPKPPKPRFFRYAVRIGRSPGIYAAYDQARPQVEGMPACHMGFTRAQVRLGLHHYYMQQTLSDKQVRKLKEGRLLEVGNATPLRYEPKAYSYYDVDRDGLPPTGAQETCTPGDAPLLLH